jgi:hypothetical protein
MSYEVTWSSNAAIWHFSGQLLGTEIIQSHTDVYGDPRFDDLSYKIIDFSEVDSIQVEPMDTKQVAYLDWAAAKTNPRIDMVIIAPSDDAKKLTHDYLQHSKELSWRMHIFDSMEAASDWIDSNNKKLQTK